MIEEDGTLTVTNKLTGETYHHLHTLLEKVMMVMNIIIHHVLMIKKSELMM